MNERALLAGGAAIFLLVAAAIGIWLRLGLGSLAQLPPTFGFVRHAHSHAATYGVLFPLLWIAWSDLGLPSPGRRLSAAYLAAAAVAVAGFWLRGYFWLSIAASTVVGAIWLVQAWRARGVVLRGPELLRPGPPGVLLAAAFVPAIAVATRRDPVLAQGLVHTFLGIVFFLVLVPAALSRLRAPEVPAPALSVLGLLAALHLGALPGRATGLGLSAFGVVIGFLAARAGGDAIARAAFVALGAGSAILGLALPATPHHTAMAGVHFLVLGPLLAALAPPPPAARVLLVAAAAVMAVLLVGADLGLPAPIAQGGAAAAGLALLPAAVLGLSRLASGRMRAP